MHDAIDYLQRVGCAEVGTEYWFRVKDNGKWNGLWSQDWNGAGERLTTEQLANRMIATRLTSA